VDRKEKGTIQYKFDLTGMQQENTHFFKERGMKIIIFFISNHNYSDSVS
jgi:hypothetical protein